MELMEQLKIRNRYIWKHGREEKTIKVIMTVAYLLGICAKNSGGQVQMGLKRNGVIINMDVSLFAQPRFNAVRARVDMPEVLGDFTDNKEKFRGRIRNERAVELMFENQRWWDIRRWMIAEDLFSGLYPIKGVEVEDKSPGQSNVLNKKLIFSKKDIKEEVREFKHRNYWYPIAKNHIEMLENVQQNPGW